MRIACYVRVSTQEQAMEGYSIQAQKNRLQAYCESQGWEIVQFFVDEGESAKDIKRPDLQRMLDMVKQDVFDIVLVYKLDRLTRSVLDLYQLLKNFEANDVKFKSATEIYDTTTATGRLFLTLIASLAQWERENLGERVSFGMEEKAKQGKWTVSIPPLGYKKDGEDLVIDEDEAVIIRLIYKMYLEGKKGMKKIAYDLNAAGYRGKKDAFFNDTRIRYILKNPLYAGTMRYNYRVNTENYFEVENVAPPIVSKEDFDQVQKMMGTRNQQHPRQATSPYIFSTVLRCHRCGSKMSAKNNSTKRNGNKYISRQYACIGRVRKGICDLPHITQNYLEIQFIKWLESINFEEESKQVSYEPSETDHTEEIKRIEGDIKSIEKRRSKWQYAWVNEMIKDEDFTQRMKEESEKEKMLLSELEAFQKKTISTDNINISELITDMTNLWPNLSVEEKKQFVQLAVKDLWVDKNPEIKRSPEGVEIKNIDFV